MNHITGDFPDPNELERIIKVFCAILLILTLVVLQFLAYIINHLAL